ncbi:MAG: HNH endonuclease signature motif containing protein [Pirellulales bacterium]
MRASLRALVRRRAGNRCEYCHLRQEHSPLVQFHVEHVIPRQHGGKSNASNLALACYRCNLHKGPNLSGINPDDGAIVTLFSPRQQLWDEHFEMRGALVVGLTPTGRATVRVLNINAIDRLRLRSELRLRGLLDA